MDAWMDTEEERLNAAGKWPLGVLCLLWFGIIGYRLDPWLWFARLFAVTMERISLFAFLAVLGYSALILKYK